MVYVFGWFYWLVFGVVKVGLVFLMKIIVIEEVEFGIIVNMVCLGDIVGDMKEVLIEEVRK